MSKVDEFKNFVKNNPNLIKYVKNGSKSWQDFFEMYDLYGNNHDIWKDYLKDDRSTSSNNFNFSSIVDIAKNIDPDKLQDGITSVQKAISLFGDIIAKNNSNNTSSYTPRPVYRRFDD